MKLDKIIYELLSKEPFFAHFILNSRVSYDKLGVKTAAAGIFQGTPQLIFSTEFMDSLSQDGQIAVFKHEILHLLFDHNDTTTYNKLNMHVWNISMDCAINQYIAHLPNTCVTVKSLEDIVGKRLLPFQSSTYYYNALYDHAEKTGQLQTLDDHGLIQESKEDQQIRKGAVSKAASAARASAAGQMPEGLESVIESLSETVLVNWQQQLRNFAASAVSSKTKGTRKKMHRRFGLDSPGRRKKRELRLAICIDTSGSVSDDQLAVFLNEIKAISKLCAEANLIYADCIVQKVINLKNGKPPPNKRYGSGGTAYGPALKKSIDLKANAIIYLGDMDVSDIPENPGIPVLWATVGSTTRPGEFGRMLEIK